MKRVFKHMALICMVMGLAYTAGAQEAKDKKYAPVEKDNAMRITVDAKAQAAREGKPIKVELAEEPALVLGAMKITLSQAIEWAVKQNFDMLSVSYDVAMVDSTYNAFLKKFAPVLSVEGSGAYFKNTPNNRTFYGDSVSQAKASASIYRNFSSGTTLRTGLTYEYDLIKRQPSAFSSLMGPSEMHKPGLFVNIQQELLKNAFGYNDRKLEEILKNSTKMQKDAIIFQLSIVIVQVIGEYWATVMDKVSLENAELQVRETKKVRDITARNATYGLADDYTLGMYNSMLAGAEAKMAKARQNYRESLRSFLTTINVDENMDVTGTAVFTNKYPPIVVEEALKTAYQKRADYQIAIKNLENSKMMLKVAYNGTLPSLVAEFNLLTSAANQNFAGGSGEFASFQYPGIEGKLKMTYPIGDKELYTQERNARFKVKQAEIQLDKYKRTVKDDILNATDNIETSYRLYQKAMEARRQSEIFYRGMLRDLGLGRLNSAVVKNGLDALVQSREMELQALVGYNISLLQFDVARNILFEKYNIDIDKYIPTDKKK